MNKIQSFVGQYRFLSNFYPVEVVLDGITYDSVEHAYQAAKTELIHERAKFVTGITAGQAKRLGRTITLRGDWDSKISNTKYYVMSDLIRQKFRDTNLRRLLIETLPKEIIEGNSWHDTYWGRCCCAKHQGQGENHLGIIIMQIRDEILNGE